MCLHSTYNVIYVHIMYIHIYTDVAADELVPLASYLLLKSDIPNWLVCVCVCVCVFPFELQSLCLCILLVYETFFN